MLHIASTTACHLPVPSQINPVHTILSSLFTTHLNITLQTVCPGFKVVQFVHVQLPKS